MRRPTLRVQTLLAASLALLSATIALGLTRGSPSAANTSGNHSLSHTQGQLHPSRPSATVSATVFSPTSTATESAAATVAIAPHTAAASAPSQLQISSGSTPNISGCPVFPADNIWNRDISSLPLAAQSSSWINNSGGTSRLIHPDFGSSGTSVPYGIPYIVVSSSHAKIAVGFQYADESDPGPYPFGPDTPIEGGAGSGGDQHAIMIDSSTCKLYELYDANYSASGSTAGSGAIWSLTSDALRPAGWTSADAAGLPIFPGLLRPEEVASGVVKHAIRMTVSTTDKSYLWPARHQAGSVTNAGYPPMGARFRLKANIDISHFSAATQVVLTAMKHYGMIVADNGSNWYFQGAASQSWDPVLIQQLKSIPAGDFEAVDTSALMIDSNSGASR